METSKKKIAIIAPGGMLGSGVYRALKDVHDLVLVARDKKKLNLLNDAYGGVQNHKIIIFDLADIEQDYLEGFQETGMGPTIQRLVDVIGNVDAVINCAGVIKPHSLTNPRATLFINGALPHALSGAYKEKLIHITTDCAYNGLTEAPYTEVSVKTPVDLYGISKVMGEPAHSLVLRTSIIGPEVGTTSSLIEWFRSKKDEPSLNGFTNHFWNGITTYQYGNIVKKIIENRDQYPKEGTYHIFSNDVSKYDMLTVFKEKYGYGGKIIPTEASVAIDRRLRTVHDLNAKLTIPSFEEMVKEL
ncbi:MAG: hypothetical protein COU90_01975 [Candidatus Ryanbacteria bacterium CG10_big_fil_rev_8_21_14_0_10_43_42]|uniref:dTDP-4-dehydrorhamnose reductase n=1 Tax=Candidatus Ryanbacteria bacterium CG10_big_fil_rev_8_21_14_0_10_43_42 TaxID=1974864 RepID=A0A2M8KXC1_9BACT|nr:MAG: hypothetical protein COU90_01975 [Candidatus Ryanbacteria bacterium CG10_big_fil_rev_8_21_14_0_10_43_42]